VIEGLKFQFADDIAIAFQCKDLKDGSAILTKDLELMKTFFHNRRLKPNPSKTEFCAFHLNNRQADDKLEVEFDGISVKHNYLHKYLGITLDRSLTFNEHISTLSKNISSRVNLVQMLAGIGWGADAKTLRVAALSIVYSIAEYGYQVWCNSTHVSRIDTQPNSVIRVISGTVKSTLMQWLPALANV
jgi:hypothetical protein